MKYFPSTSLVASWLAIACGAAAQSQRVQLSSDSHGQPSEPADRREGAAPAENQPGEQPSDECRKSNAALTLSVDRKTVNLEEGRLQAKMDGPICGLVMRITRKDGPAIEKSFHYAGPEQELRWDPMPKEQIEKIEVRITAKNNAYQAVALVPWFARIEHKEVKFDTNKAIIKDSEVASLKDSLTKINEVLHKMEGKGLGPITLFIAGHTDTRGSDEKNMILSRNRAQAIADWFLKQGVCAPIAFEGFGETALRKVTADEVDEPANRRVDYILSVEPPVIKKGATPAWKLLSKGCP